MGHTSNVATRPVKAGDEAERDWVNADLEDNRNDRGRRLCRNCRRSAGRSNHGHLTMDQISNHRRQPVGSTLSPAIFDCDVAAIDVTGFAQPFEKG